ncbi:hypothetical protein [Marinactinospora rubrisoli]|uniref:Uncharacterized protein n=1 Tax=Marinactinospora rubrisoli TaxID=2715399 RepID=A0ABW2KGR9_9ACTN
MNDNEPGGDEPWPQAGKAPAAEPGTATGLAAQRSREATLPTRAGWERHRAALADHARRAAQHADPAALAEERADLVLSAWRAGYRNTRALAKSLGVSPETVHADLRFAGVDPATDRGAPPSGEEPTTPSRPRRA